jgi:hypothetical protein
MKHSKLIYGAGALLLAVAGALAGKASVKANANPVYFTTGVSPNKHCAPLTSLGSIVFTTGASGTGVNQATIKTASGGSARLWGTNTCSTGAKPAHLKTL